MIISLPVFPFRPLRGHRNGGMISPGDHYDFDSLRDAPPSRKVMDLPAGMIVDLQWCVRSAG